MEPQPIKILPSAAQTEADIITIIYNRMFPILSRVETKAVMKEVFEYQREQLIEGGALLIPDVGKLRARYVSGIRGTTEVFDPPIPRTFFKPNRKMMQEWDDRTPEARNYRRSSYKWHLGRKEPLPLWLKPYYPNYAYGYTG